MFNWNNEIAGHKSRPINRRHTNTKKHIHAPNINGIALENQCPKKNISTIFFCRSLCLRGIRRHGILHPSLWNAMLPTKAGQQKKASKKKKRFRLIGPRETVCVQCNLIHDPRLTFAAGHRRATASNEWNDSAPKKKFEWIKSTENSNNNR